ncbi:MAG: c-type cytochrome [Roseicyclus sp.]|uniref:c-type cytochrome n=1 Tax=Roseicyclus sp. TaxID=1914329 RepID=UPI003A8B5AC0
MGLTAAAAQGMSGHAGPVSALATDGERLVSGGFDGRAILWSPDLQTARGVERFHDGNVTATALLPDARHLTAGQDGRVALWGDAGDLLFSTPHGISPVAALAVSPDHTVIAVGFWDGRLVLMDIEGREISSVQAHAGRLAGLAFLPSGDLVSVGGDLRFFRWDGSLSVQASAGLPDLPNGLARVGDRLAVIFAEGALRLFSPEGEVLPERFLSERPLVAVTASPDTVAAAAVDGTIWILGAETLQVRAEIAPEGGPVWALALAGDTLVAGGASGTIRRHATADGARIGQAQSMIADAYDDGSRGAEVWRACAICHSLEPGDHSRAGPSLHGIFDRPIASVEGYAFSPALRDLDIVWTPRSVAELFEVGPEIYTPGSRMPDQRVADPADRQALVEFLERASR